MTQPGYQEGSEPVWWWRVAQHLDAAQIALANAIAHNLEDQRPVFDLQDRLREGQSILFEIFRMKGLIPGSTNGKIETPLPEADPPVAPPPAPAVIVDAALVDQVSTPIEEAAAPVADQVVADQPAVVAGESSSPDVVLLPEVVDAVSSELPAARAEGDEIV